MAFAIDDDDLLSIFGSRVRMSDLDKYGGRVDDGLTQCHRITFVAMHTEQLYNDG